MRIIRNSILPLNGFSCFNLCGVLFVRPDTNVNDRLLAHEAIHTAQMRELAYVGFYIIYVLEWLYRLVVHTSTAYRGLSFEREAYAHQRDKHIDRYLRTRKRFAQWRA